MMIIDPIETARLLLREISEEDAEQIVEWRSDPNVYKYFKSPHRLTLAEHLNWYYTDYLRNEKRIDLMCIEKESERKIGVFGLCKQDNEAEVNYLLASEAQHKGYAREALSVLVTFTSKNWAVDRIIAEIHRLNYPSISLVQALGFTVNRSDGEFLFYKL